MIFMRTNSLVRTVKSCGPGFPVLKPSWAAMLTHRANDRGKRAGPWGEREVSRNAIARGMPGCLG
jgi:hypothetical protein